MLSLQGTDLNFRPWTLVQSVSLSLNVITSEVLVIQSSKRKGQLRNLDVFIFIIKSLKNMFTDKLLSYIHIKIV